MAQNQKRSIALGRVASLKYVESEAVRGAMDVILRDTFW